MEAAWTDCWLHHQGPCFCVSLLRVLHHVSLKRIKLAGVTYFGSRLRWAIVSCLITVCGTPRGLKLIGQCMRGRSLALSLLLRGAPALQSRHEEMWSLRTWEETVDGAISSAGTAVDTAGTAYRYTLDLCSLIKKGRSRNLPLA
jgi:hypothetical protein